MKNIVKGLNKTEKREKEERFAKKINTLPGINVGEKGINFFERTRGVTNFRYLTNLFKAEAILSPAFHIRNAISAFATNSMFGIDASLHGDAVRFLWKMSRINKARAILSSSTVARLKESRILKLEKLKAMADLPDDEDLKLFKEMQEMGIFGTRVAGQTRQEGGLLATGSINPGSTEFLPYRWNFAVGQSIEDVVRTATYMHGRRVLGYGKEEARALVHALHFNYNLLSDSELRWFRVAIPFYSYLRLALARDSRLFIQRTGEFNKMAHLVDAAEKDVPPEESVEVAHYVRENLGVRFRVNNNGRVE